MPKSSASHRPGPRPGALIAALTALFAVLLLALVPAMASAQDPTDRIRAELREACGKNFGEYNNTAINECVRAEMQAFRALPEIHARARKAPHGTTVIAACTDRHPLSFRHQQYCIDYELEAAERLVAFLDGQGQHSPRRALAQACMKSSERSFADALKCIASARQVGAPDG